MLGALESQALTSWISRFELYKRALCLPFLGFSVRESADRHGAHPATEPRLQLEDNPYIRLRGAHVALAFAQE